MWRNHLDPILWNSILAVCCVLLLGITGLTAYVVVMRYIFLAPPFWGDTVSLLANIWLVMLSVSIAVRHEESLAMQSVYAFLPTYIWLSLDVFWNGITVLFGLYLVAFGYAAASEVPGMFWELNGLPKRYTLMIMPIAGLLIALAATLVMIETIRRARARKGKLDNSV